ncbi:MAG TPA: hypothetical protein VFB43_06910 [Terracidiphilus sp.]|nr:hypothetical protein [Terracidiphilus sp.]
MIEAMYSGDSVFASSTGSVTVNVGGSGGGSSGGSFTLSATNVAVSQGNSGTSTITVGSQNSYGGTVGFTLSTSSTSLQQNGCYSAPNVTAAANKTVTGTLTIYTSKSVCNSGSIRYGVQFLTASGSGPLSSAQNSPGVGRTIPIGFAIATGSLLLGKRRRRIWVRACLGCCFLILILGLITSCGGSSNGGSNSGGDVAKGMYTLTLNGTDTSNSSIAASTPLILTVQ